MARKKKARPNWRHAYTDLEREHAELESRVDAFKRDAESFRLLADTIYDVIKERLLEDIRQEISEALDEVTISH